MKVMNSNKSKLDHENDDQESFSAWPAEKQLNAGMNNAAHVDFKMNVPNKNNSNENTGKGAPKSAMIGMLDEQKIIN